MGALAYRIGGKARTGQGVARARVKAIPAPVKGWNAKDPLSAMDPQFATILENWFPDSGYVALRKGSADHATGVGSGEVETVFNFSANGASVLLAGGGGKLYDVSAAGTATNLTASITAFGTAFDNDRWQGVNFYNVAILVNGGDTPLSFDGSTMTTAGFTGTGLTAANLIYVASFKERLFLIEKDTANFWYGTVKQITGALVKFELGAVHPGGGKLVAAGTFTIDGGAGPEDLIGFFFENGDIAVYQGTNPGDAAEWAIVGRFKIGRPVGQRPLLQIGADLLAITEDGYMPVRQFMGSGRTAKRLAVSDNISRAVNEAVNLYRGNFGWELGLYAAGNMMIANVPKVEGAQSEQHVMNTLTGAWCKFTGLNAICWAVHENVAYFGTSGGKVQKFDIGNADAGADIIADAQTAFVYFGGEERIKSFTLFKPYLQSDNPVRVSMGLGVDFAEGIVTAEASVPGGAGEQFDVALFDEAFFAGGFTAQDDWQSAGEIGYAAAVRMKTQTSAHNMRWFATSVVWKPGGIL